MEQMPDASENIRRPVFAYCKAGMGVGERAEGLKESEAGRKVFGPTFLQKGRGQKEEKICREV